MRSGITNSASHVLPWESACQHCPLLCWIQRGFVFPTFLGKISPWTGRFYSLLDPSYAKNNIPIIASVSEHQPTTWSSYYFDLQLLVFMFPGESLDLESVTRGFSCWSKSSGACCVLLSLSAWFYFISELNLTSFFSSLTVGLYYCFSNLSDARIFIIMYGVTSMYFSAVMVRAVGTSTASEP